MKLFLYMCVVALVFACSGKKQAEENAGNATLQGDVIVLPAGSPVKEKLKVGEIKLSPFKRDFSTSGEVKAIPSGYAEIASPFAGRIIRSFVRLGQRLSPGSPVFEISSPDFFEAGKSYFQAKQEMELALKSLNREKDLFSNHVGVQKELEEAEVNYELKKKDYENAVAALKVFQITPEEMIPGQPLIVRSPIAGEVVRNTLVLGQYLKEDAEPVVVVANLDKVWVVAHVKEKDISLVRDLDEVEVSLIAVPGKIFQGKVYHVSEMLDEDTRSVEVLIECENQERLMKPAMYGSVKLIDAPSEALLVPTSAILQQEEFCYVLVALDENHFRKQKVETSATQGDRTVVETGLHPGDKIVTEGAFYLLDVR